MLPPSPMKAKKVNQRTVPLAQTSAAKELALQVFQPYDLSRQVTVFVRDAHSPRLEEYPKRLYCLKRR